MTLVMRGVMHHGSLGKPCRKHQYQTQSGGTKDADKVHVGSLCGGCVQRRYFNFVVHILYLHAPSHPTGGVSLRMAGLLARGSMHPAAFPDCSSGFGGRVLSAYSRGGGFGIASLIGSRLPNSHFSPLCFARCGEPCWDTMLQCRSVGQGRFRQTKRISRQTCLGENSQHLGDNPVELAICSGFALTQAGWVQTMAY